MLRRVVSLKLTYFSDVVTASVNRAMSKRRAEKWVKKRNQAGQSRTNGLRGDKEPIGGTKKNIRTSMEQKGGHLTRRQTFFIAEFYIHTANNIMGNNFQINYH
jgi:hypothetical protein